MPVTPPWLLGWQARTWETLCVSSTQLSSCCAVYDPPPPQGCITRGGRYPPPPKGAQPMPSHCLPDAKCHLWPTVTAPNRFCNLLRTPV